MKFIPNDHLYANELNSEIPELERLALKNHFKRIGKAGEKWYNMI